MQVVNVSIFFFYLHATVVLKQRNQVAVLTDLVLDVPHQGANAGLVAAVGVSWHAALQEVLLLRIFLQGHKELCHLILLLKHKGGNESSRGRPIQNYTEFLSIILSELSNWSEPG